MAKIEYEKAVRALRIGYNSIFNVGNLPVESSLHEASSAFNLFKQRIHANYIISEEAAISIVTKMFFYLGHFYNDIAERGSIYYVFEAVYNKLYADKPKIDSKEYNIDKLKQNVFFVCYDRGQYIPWSSREKIFAFMRASIRVALPFDDLNLQDRTAFIPLSSFGNYPVGKTHAFFDFPFAVVQMLIPEQFPAKTISNLFDFLFGRSSCNRKTILLFNHADTIIYFRDAFEEKLIKEEEVKKNEMSASFSTYIFNNIDQYVIK